MRAIHHACALRLVCVLTASAVAMVGCTSMHPVPVVTATAPQQVVPPVKPGDDILITMRDGRTAKFQVETVEPGAIIASGGTKYQMADILEVTRREFSWPKTTLLIVGASVGSLLVGVIALLSSDSPFGGLSSR